jgi:calcium/calmodulin-dependent 3',5'-cyclic nucleotide phosphodiesterase
VSYHNDLHGADVAQHAHLLLNYGLKKILELNDTDVLSILIACVSHDYRHDGFTNGYHINIASQRAITYNDLSV